MASAVGCPVTFVGSAPPRLVASCGLREAGNSAQPPAPTHTAGLSYPTLLPGATLVAAAVAGVAHRRSSAARPRTRHVAVACAASPEEESLKRAIWNAPSKGAKDVQRVTKEIESLPSPPKTAMKMIDGHWKCDWNSVNGTQAKKTLMSYVCDKLPGILVNFFDSYYRISGDQVDFVEAFTMAGNERVDAALVWSGKRKKDKGNQLHFQFDSIKLCPADASTGMSKEMLQSEGLGKFMKPTKIKEEATYIELDHISDAMQAHHEEDENARWVFSKIRVVPFILD